MRLQKRSEDDRKREKERRGWRRKKTMKRGQRKWGGKTESDQIKEKQKRHERRRQRQIDGHRDEE